MSRLGLERDEVKLQEYDSSWQKEFMGEEQKIKSLNARGLITVEHVGSTAVPGMLAKPIIDILIGIDKYKDFKKLIKPLETIGYVFYREPRRYQALFLKKSKKGLATHHLKVVKYKGKSWSEYIRFRDTLRTNKKLLNKYRQLKQSLVKNNLDRKAYTQGKIKLIQEILCN
jgi:GrpB-like predicted nucleotidyltransferase (UPF0157 family)